MSILHVGQIEAAIEKRFLGLIDTSDASRCQENDHFLTRGLSAFVIAALAQAKDPEAAQSVVDEGGDGGIDAVYFNATERRCYLVQSKWIKKGDGGPGVGSVLKFMDGVHHFFQADREFFGPKMQKLWPSIMEILKDPANRLVIVLAYT